MFKTLINSRTVWTVVIMFLVAGIGAIREFLGIAYEPIMAILGVLAIYFKVNPSQRYDVR